MRNAATATGRDSDPGRWNPVHAKARVNTQGEFFHTFNALHEAGRQIVIASDAPPARFALAGAAESRGFHGPDRSFQAPIGDPHGRFLHKKLSRSGCVCPAISSNTLAGRFTSTSVKTGGCPHPGPSPSPRSRTADDGGIGGADARSCRQ